MTSCPDVRGQPQKLCFQVCFVRLNFRLNAWRHITQKLVMSRVQNSRQRGNLNLSNDWQATCTLVAGSKSQFKNDGKCSQFSLLQYLTVGNTSPPSKQQQLCFFNVILAPSLVFTSVQHFTFCFSWHMKLWLMIRQPYHVQVNILLLSPTEKSKCQYLLGLA